MKKYLCGFFIYGMFWTEIFSQTTNQGNNLKKISFLNLLHADVYLVHVFRMTKLDKPPQSELRTIIVIFP